LVRTSATVAATAVDATTTTVQERPGGVVIRGLDDDSRAAPDGKSRHNNALLAPVVAVARLVAAFPRHGDPPEAPLAVCDGKGNGKSEAPVQRGLR
jgi:hypothetical protein